MVSIIINSQFSLPAMSCTSKRGALKTLCVKHKLSPLLKKMQIQRNSFYWGLRNHDSTATILLQGFGQSEATWVG